MNFNCVKGAFGVAVALGLMATSASAQATRTWVSGVGDDANPCSRTAPCKTFAGAISKTAAGGEIDALDPGGFGVVTITKAITIDGGPNAGGILNAGTTGVIINAAATDKIILRRLNISGGGSTSIGLQGIRVLSAGTVHVEKCQIANQDQKGINVDTTAATRLFVNDTEIRDNINGATGGGIFLKPGVGGSVTCYLDRVRLYKNTFGIRVENDSTVIARDCDFSGNDTHGVVAVAATSIVNLDRCSMSRNLSAGLRSTGGSTIRFGNCLITNNAIGLDNVGGNLVSFTNNMNGGNTTPGSPSATIPLQ